MKNIKDRLAFLLECQHFKQLVLFQFLLETDEKSLIIMYLRK